MLIKMKKFILKKDIQGLYIILKKGYTDILDYPNIDDGEEIGICEGHGEYTWVKKEDIEIIGD